MRRLDNASTVHILWTRFASCQLRTHRARRCRLSSHSIIHWWRWASVWGRCEALCRRHRRRLPASRVRLQHASRSPPLIWRCPPERAVLRVEEQRMLALESPVRPSLLGVGHFESHAGSDRSCCSLGRKSTTARCRCLE